MDLEGLSPSRSFPGLCVENASFALKSGRQIISEVSFKVERGKLCALMGPSGAGKTTLLDIVAGRVKGANGNIAWEGALDWSPIRDASYSEQTDDLIGVLSIRETLHFACKLARGTHAAQSDIESVVESVISDLGLAHVADNRIGTPITRGISGGQKRRVTLGTSLVSGRKLMLLDEPTSGLDSTSSREVISALRVLAHREQVAVLAVIHQPSFETLSLFDNCLFLARGETVYYGPVSGLPLYMCELGKPVAEHLNPADAMLDLCSTDFAETKEGEEHIPLVQLVAQWRSREDSRTSIDKCEGVIMDHRRQLRAMHGIRKLLFSTAVLSHRNLLNYTRNLLAYGIRIGMFLGMGVMMALVWMNLPLTDSHVQDRLSVSFYSVAFLSFMSVAGVPAFLEERSVFMRERRNGLYSPAAYALANTITNLPFIFVCAVLFLIVAYFSIGLQHGHDAAAFFRYLAYVFLALIAAESQSVLVAAIVPLFVAALAIVAFLNGFWMSVGGYFIRSDNIPRWLWHWATQIDYQRYSFDLLVASDLGGLRFACSQTNDSCYCQYASSIQSPSTCSVSGQDILNSVGIGTFPVAQYIGILISIIVIYRLLFWLALEYRR